jgi:DNA-binding transcriptional MocR family regulator
MTIWEPALDRAIRPRYLAIVSALQQDIQAGRLQPGTRLPTHRDLAFRLGVTVGTISRAYAEADRRGLLHGEVGRGTFVRPRAGMGLLRLHPEEPGIIDLSMSRPCDGGADRELAATLGALANRQDLAPLLAYQSELGLPAHRAAGAAWLARATGLAAQPERIVVVGGGQHGLHTTFVALLRPGDVVLTEALTYPGFKLLAGQLGITLEGVRIDGEGLVPEALEAACQRWRPRALLTVPTLHNPTAAIIPEARRREILEIARRHELLVIEDDVYGFLAEARPTLLANLAPERVVYVSSLSKSMAPGLRLGYLQAPAEMIGRIGATLRGSVWMTSPLLAEIASIWIDSGAGDRLAAERRRVVLESQAIAQRFFAGQSIATQPNSYHLWLTLPEPWRASGFVAEARSRGVLVTAPEPFVAGREPAPNAVRVCVGAVEDPERLETALGILKSLLEAPGASAMAVV